MHLIQIIRESECHYGQSNSNSKTGYTNPASEDQRKVTAWRGDWDECAAQVDFANWIAHGGKGRLSGRTHWRHCGAKNCFSRLTSRFISPMNHWVSRSSRRVSCWASSEAVSNSNKCRLAMQIILRVMLEMIFCVTACSLLQHLLREHQHEMA